MEFVTQLGHIRFDVVDEIRRTAGHTCAYTAVRFGNVLGSSGSVVPIFRRQIAAGDVDRGEDSVDVGVVVVEGERRRGEEQHQRGERQCKPHCP